MTVLKVDLVGKFFLPLYRLFFVTFGFGANKRLHRQVCKPITWLKQKIEIITTVGC